MITTKQRAYLRSLANTIEPTTQIGKFGIGETLIETVEKALEAHELIKLTILETCPETPKEALVSLCIAKRFRSSAERSLSTANRARSKTARSYYREDKRKSCAILKLHSFFVLFA